MSRGNGLQLGLNRLGLLLHKRKRRLHSLSCFFDFLLDLQQQIHIRNHRVLHHRSEHRGLDLFVLQLHRIEQLDILGEEVGLTEALKRLRHGEKRVLGFIACSWDYSAENGGVRKGDGEEREGLASTIDGDLLDEVGREESENDVGEKGGVDGLSVRERERRGTEMPRGAEGNWASCEMIGVSIVGSDKRWAIQGNST